MPCKLSDSELGRGDEILQILNVRGSRHNGLDLSPYLCTKPSKEKWQLLQQTLGLMVVNTWHRQVLVQKSQQINNSYKATNFHRYVTYQEYLRDGAKWNLRKNEAWMEWEWKSLNHTMWYSRNDSTLSLTENMKILQLYPHMLLGIWKIKHIFGHKT